MKQDEDEKTEREESILSVIINTIWKIRHLKRHIENVISLPHSRALISPTGVIFQWLHLQTAVLYILHTVVYLTNLCLFVLIN